METGKIVGYFLLGLGIILIVFALYSAFDVFTGSAKPAPVADLGGISISQPVPAGVAAEPIKIELISGKEASKIVNIGIWYLFMFFVVSVGAKISTIGVKLVK
jgi:hypothetical protein